MSLVLKLDKLRPELLSAAFAVAYPAPSASEMELAQDKVRQIRARRYKMLPADIHRANTVMATKGKAAYDLLVNEERERFETARTDDLTEALEELGALEAQLAKSTTEGILLHALELGLLALAEGNDAVRKAMLPTKARA